MDIEEKPKIITKRKRGSKSSCDGCKSKKILCCGFKPCSNCEIRDLLCVGDNLLEKPVVLTAVESSEELELEDRLNEIRRLKSVLFFLMKQMRELKAEPVNSNSSSNTASILSSNHSSSSTATTSNLSSSNNKIELVNSPLALFSSYKHLPVEEKYKLVNDEYQNRMKAIFGVEGVFYNQVSEKEREISMIKCWKEAREYFGFEEEDVVLV